MNYFEGCSTAHERKEKWKSLCKVYHPDVGGDIRIMQEINRQYRELSVIKPKFVKRAGFSEEVEPKESFWKKTNTNPFNGGSLSDWADIKFKETFDE